MKYFPQITIGVSALVAIFALIFYFQQTSPEVTEQASQSVTVVNEEQSSAPEQPPVQAVEEAAEQSPQNEPENTQEASLSVEGYGINLARVRPDGSAIIAGNAAAGSTINLIKDGQIIGTATTSDQGEWVIIPDMMLEQGAHLLSIEIINPDGSKQIGDMALAIEMIDSTETPLVALVPYTEEATTAATLLQAPDAIDPTASSSADTVKATTAVTETEASTIAAADTEVAITPVMPRITIRSIQAVNPKTISISGVAEGGEAVRIMLNGIEAASSTPDDKAMYAVLITIDPDLAKYTLKSILNDKDNNAIASASITLSKAQIDQGLDGNALIVVQKGDALWRIAYKTYGAGIRYVDIVRQNPTKINDPDLIYPDQIFVIPNG